MRQLNVVSCQALSTRLTGYHERQILVRMHVAITQCAAIENRRMIEERTVAILRRFQLGHEMGEQFGKLPDLAKEKTSP